MRFGRSAGPATIWACHRVGEPNFVWYSNHDDSSEALQVVCELQHKPDDVSVFAWNGFWKLYKILIQLPGIP